MKPIESREDLFFLVNEFYDKIRSDAMLAPIFNQHILMNQWDEHLEKLTDFWETNLFGVAKFKGNPTQKHIQVDVNLDYKIHQEHFGRWLQLWFETIDSNFQGDLAFKAKESARKMAFGQYFSIWKARPEDCKE